MKKIGFIGAGNMAQAIMKGILKSQQALPEDIMAFDVYQSLTEALHQELGIVNVSDSDQVFKQADVIILAVKPDVVLSVLVQNKQFLKENQLVISIAAGVSLAKLVEASSTHTKLIRMMPNTPALVGVGMSALTANEQVNEAERTQIQTLFESFGRVIWVPESKMHTVTGVSGSGPAYAFMFIEALADAGVLGGLTKQQSLLLAAQTLLGSAQMVLETSQHPAVLKNNVCSPGGTTIAAVKELEDRCFRSTVINAAVAAMAKSKELM